MIDISHFLQIDKKNLLKMYSIIQTFLIRVPII